MGEELISKIPAVPETVVDVEEGDYGEDLKLLEFRTKLNVVEKLEHELIAERLMLDHRKRFSWVIFALSLGWLAFLASFLWHFISQTELKSVSDSVFITLIS